MTLQYQLSNGSWTDCDERTEEFLVRCEKFNGIDAAGKTCPAFRAVRPLTRDELLAELSAGRELRNASGDWYCNCRDAEAVESLTAARRAAQPPIEMRRCTCGHTVPAALVMSSSRGSSCPECYDRMSV